MLWLLLIASAMYSGELTTHHTIAEKNEVLQNALHAATPLNQS